MNGIRELCRLIDNKCACIGGYNEILLKDCIVAYTIYQGIYLGTQGWENMINFLWLNLNTPALIDSFNTKEEFNDYISYDLR